MDIVALTTVISRRKGEERKVLDHGRIRTCNLLLRRQTRYPLRHAAYCGWTSWAHQKRSEKFSTTAGFEPAIFCSVGRRVIHCATRPAVDGYRGTPTVISRRKGEERKVLDHGRIRTCNLLLRRQTRYPLRHAAYCGWISWHSNGD
ncbi:hypothetical protein RB195_007614 [Necator americanus]|uniref:Protein kinase domain-containing protein n=1 Tax=Necator americanus TaxID=51031 RepID=A0ABR1C1J1_NECAM